RSPRCVRGAPIPHLRARAEARRARTAVRRCSRGEVSHERASLPRARARARRRPELCPAEGASAVKRFRLARRAVLRGLCGAAVGLPLLDCMVPSTRSVARAQNTSGPRRYAIVFAGQAIGGDGWERDRFMIGGERIQEAGHFIVPEQAGNAYTLTTPLRPLAELRREFSLVSGLAIPYSKTSAEPSEVPPGGAYRDFHGGGAGPLLCGTRSE